MRLSPCIAEGVSLTCPASHSLQAEEYGAVVHAIDLSVNMVSIALERAVLRPKEAQVCSYVCPYICPCIHASVCTCVLTLLELRRQLQFYIISIPF